MASWIKFDTTTSDKPEVWQIAADLGIDPDAVVGKLLRVWTWFDTHSENGNAPIVTKVTLDRHVGNAGFCDAMVRAGWMSDDGVSIGLPNFERHNGQTAKNRALTAVRVANCKRKGNGDGNDELTEGALPRIDKKRIDKKEDQKKETHRAPRSVTVSVDELVSTYGVDKQVADDWMTVRKAKKAPLTQTALDNLLPKFTAAGLTVPVGIKTCVEKGWVGFEPEWLTGSKPFGGKPSGRHDLSTMNYELGVNPDGRI